MNRRSLAATFLTSALCFTNSDAATSPKDELSFTRHDTSVSFYRRGELACNVIDIREQYRRESLTTSRDGLAIILSPTQFISIHDIDYCAGKTVRPKFLSLPNAVLIDIDVKNQRFISKDQDLFSVSAYVAVLGKLNNAKKKEITEIYADCRTSNQEMKKKLLDISEAFKLDCPSSSNASSTGAKLFDKTIHNIFGDLNGDGQPDHAVVTQDTTDDYGTYRLQVYISARDGTSNLVATSTRVIPPDYSDGNKERPPEFDTPNVTIRNGILEIDSEFLHGRTKRKFRFQNNDLELIGYFYSYGKMGSSTTVDYNLSTGIRVETSEEVNEKGKVVHYERTRKVLIRALPNLQDVAPLENAFY